MGLTIAGVEPSNLIIDTRTPQTGPVALEATGNVTITDGVATGFSATSVLKTGQGFDFSQPNYQIRCRFKCTGQSGTTPIFRAYEESSFLVGPTNASTVEAYIRFTNESANTKYPDIITNFSDGKIYEFVFERINGTYYQLSITNITDNKLEGAYKWNRTQDIYPGNATVPISFGGGRADASSSYLHGELYTDYTYISVGSQLWSGTLPSERTSDFLVIDNKLVWVNPRSYLTVYQTPTSPTKFFRTNIQLNSSSKVEMIFKPSQYANNYCLWCCRNDAQNKTFSMFNVSRNYRFDYYTSQTSIGSSTSLTKTNITVDGNKAYVNGTLKATVTAQTFTPDYGMVIFASNTGGGTTYGNGFSGEFYSMKIYLDGTNLSYHFVPIPGGLTIGSYTTPSTGIFDLVNQQFYANSGSGNFFWGKDE